MNGISDLRNLAGQTTGPERRPVVSNAPPSRLGRCAIIARPSSHRLACEADELRELEPPRSFRCRLQKKKTLLASTSRHAGARCRHTRHQSCASQPQAWLVTCCKTSCTPFSEAQSSSTQLEPLLKPRRPLHEGSELLQELRPRQALIVFGPAAAGLKNRKARKGEDRRFASQ